MGSWISARSQQDTTGLELIGDWRLPHIVAIENELKALKPPQRGKIVVKGSNLKALDTSGALALIQFIGWPDSKERVQFEGFSESFGNILELVKNAYVPRPEGYVPHKLNPLQKLGRGTIKVLLILVNLCAFIGETLYEVGRELRNPRSFRVKETVAQMEYVCLDAIPIVALVNFLIGVVVAYLFGSQIQKYGGNIFVVDGCGLAMLRELSPILVAIIVAGRSGSAFTAQIGTMKLNEELDAMVSLSLSPMRVLVVPRIAALTLTMPLLVFVGDVVGMLGSLFIAHVQLGITGVTFLERFRAVVPVKHLFVGLGKAPVFAVFIAIIGCHLGLTVEDNSRSVGEHTTATVVRSIVAVILLNAGFAVLLVRLGI